MSHWSEKTGSITYELGATVELRSFPFSDGVVDTPTKLNNALGDCLMDIIGEGYSAHNRAWETHGNDWIGSLTEISPDKAYWLKPSGSVFRSGSVESGYSSVTKSITGVIRNPIENYDLHNHANMVSYPHTRSLYPGLQDYDENIHSGIADPDRVHFVLNGHAVYRGLNAIIGQGEASSFVGMQNWSLQDQGWIGTAHAPFKPGMGYWFKFSGSQEDGTGWYADNQWDSGDGQLWNAVTGAATYHIPPAASGSEYVHCDHVVNGDRKPGWGCSTKVDPNSTAEPPYTDNPDQEVYPYSQSGHTFGRSQYSTVQEFYLISSSIGCDSGSLYQADGTEVQAPLYGGWMISFYNYDSSLPSPNVIGAEYWFSHIHSEFRDPFWTGSNKIMTCHLQGSDGSEGTTYRGYPTIGQRIGVRVYDPIRDVMVEADFHTCSYSGGNAIIDSNPYIMKHGGNNKIHSMWSGSGVIDGEEYHGAVAIKLRG